MPLTMPSAKNQTNPKTEAACFQPVLLVEVELSQSLPDLSSLNASNGFRYLRAQCLVRLHSQPLGVVDLDLGEEGLSAAQYHPRIWQVLHREINAHLEQDGFTAIAELSASGLHTNGLPACLQVRARFLDSAPFVSVIVCTRDRTEQLAVCLPRLLALQYPNFEVVLVDNAPKTSATADLVAQTYAHVPYLRYVREDRPGLSWARNKGLQNARGIFVAYTDDDVVVDSHWLAALMMAFQIDENVGFVSGLTLPAELETQAQAWFEQFASFARGYTRIVHNVHSKPLPDPLYPFSAVGYGSGVNIAFNTSVLREIGGFNPALGAGTWTRGGEDLAVFLQCAAKGYTIVYEPAAILRHYHRRDFLGLQTQAYDFGLGFSSFLVNSIVVDPKRFFKLAGKATYGLRALFGPSTPRIARRSDDFPKSLARNELKGMLSGPIAYARSRWHTRQIIRDFGPIDVKAVPPAPDLNMVTRSK